MKGQERSKRKFVKPVALGSGILIIVFILYTSLGPRKESSSSLFVQHDETRTKLKLKVPVKTAASSNWIKKFGDIDDEGSAGSWDSDDYSDWPIADYSDLYWDKEAMDTGKDQFGNATKHTDQAEDQAEEQTKKRPPDFIIIGVRKCGTRALLEMISIHPQVGTVGPEVHYFDKDENYKKGLSWYIDQMKLSTEWQITGEKSPSYFVVPGVPKRVKNYFTKVHKEPKLLLVVREPVSRIVSDFTQGLFNRGDHVLDNTSIQAEFIKRAIDPITRGVNRKWSAITVSKYSSHLQRWRTWFPREQLFIVNGDTLRTNPIEEMTKVSEFLKLEGSFDWKSSLYFNATRGFYCFKKNGSPVCLGSSKGRKHPDIDATILNKLRDYYKPFNEEFKNMTGLDFQKTDP